MPYHLCQVEDRLKQAYSRAIQQIDAGASEFSDLRSQKLEPDIGHASAIQQANIAPVLIDGRQLSWRENRFRRGELKGRTVIIGDPADFNQKKVWTIHVSDQREYPIFLLRSHLYLTLRGIPYSLRHKTADKLLRGSNQIGGMSIWTQLTIQEEALAFARIPLNEPTGFRDVEPNLGIIKSSETARVVKAFVATPPPGGMHRVYPGDKLFLLEVWTTPSMKKDLLINAPVGGLVERVQVKAGDSVQKNQELVRLKDPFQEDPWPYGRCSIP